MNPEVGKYYKTRSNKKVKVVHIFPGGGLFPVAVADDAAEAGNTYMYWVTIGGKVALARDGALDLLEEWREPISKVMYGVMSTKYENAKPILSATVAEAIADRETMPGPEGWAIVEITIKEEME